jgi:hypothetical protein
MFFAALIGLVIGGLREPFISALIICAAGAVFAVAYLRASRARDRNAGPSHKVR